MENKQPITKELNVFLKKKIMQFETQTYSTEEYSRIFQNKDNQR